MKRLVLRLGAIALCAIASPAYPGSLTAIVEDVAGAPPGVDAMDYVEQGRVIQLGPQDSIVLSYLTSCVREVISGGPARVGVDQSESQGAHIERTKVDCQAGKMMTAPGQKVDAAGFVLRGASQSEESLPRVRPAQAVEFMLYGSSPMIELDGDGKLVVARLDRKGEYFDIAIDRSRLLHQRFFDFATNGMSLTAGGVYGARWDKRLVVFKIDPTAAPGRAPLLGRLVRLGLSP